MTDPQRAFDQQRYEALRAELLDRNEGSVNNIYLDPLGIPTVGIGVALTARQHDRSFRVDQNHVDALSDVLHLSDPQRQQLNGLLEAQAGVQSRHKDESARNLPAFLAKPFGHESQEVLGPMVNTRHQTPGTTFYSWDVLTSPTSPMQIRLSHQQSIDLLQRVAPQYEDLLKGTLKDANCPPQALSEEQRAAIYSMVYQNSMAKASRTAHAIGDYWHGVITEEQLKSRLQHSVHDAKFPERSRNELEYLEHIHLRSEQQRAQPGQHSNQSAPSQGHGHAYQEISNVSADAVVAALDPKDRAIYDRIRASAPQTLSDDVVLQATADLKQAGLTNAQSIEKMALHNGAFFITSDHTAGYAHSKTVVEGQQQDPSLAAQQIEQVNQQQQQQNQAFQQQQQNQTMTMSMS